MKGVTDLLLHAKNCAKIAESAKAAKEIKIRNFLVALLASLALLAQSVPLRTE
jgi:hypothetical protein